MLRSGISTAIPTSNRRMTLCSSTEPTNNLTEPMRHETDVFIVGGGPAGLAVAIAARGKGFDVTVADGGGPPIDKPCGEGLLPDAVAALRRLGVVLGPADGFLLRGIRFADAGTSIGAGFREGFGLGVRRKVLHRRLVERAQECGVRLAWKTPVSGLWKCGVVAGGNRVRARWIVGADGIGSRVKRWTGLEMAGTGRSRFAYRQHFRARAWNDLAEVYWHKDEQIYITPVSHDEICVALISNSPKARIGEALKRIPELSRRLQGSVVTSTERGTVTRVRRLAHVRRGSVALVGDASGTVDAITAEGLALGFRQAQALADGLEAGNLEQYEREHRRLFLRPRFMAQVLLFLAEQERIRRHAFQVMEAAPNIFDCMLAYHVGETRPLELAATGAQFGWRFLTALV